jgi:hypothetical protein
MRKGPGNVDDKWNISRVSCWYTFWYIVKYLNVVIVASQGAVTNQSLLGILSGIYVKSYYKYILLYTPVDHRVNDLTNLKHTNNSLRVVYQIVMVRIND